MFLESDLSKNELVYIQYVFTVGNVKTLIPNT